MYLWDNTWMKWFKFLFSLMPDLSGFKELGFKVSTMRGQLFVKRESPLYNLWFTQGLEPDNRIWGDLVDFDIPDGFFVIELKHEFKSDEGLKLLDSVISLLGLLVIPNIK